MKTKPFFQTNSKQYTSKTQIVTNPKLKLWQFLNSNCEKTLTVYVIFKKSQTVNKTKLWENLNTQVATKLEHLNCDKKKKKKKKTKQKN